LIFSHLHLSPHHRTQLRTIFNLPSTTHTFWVNVLLFPDDAQDARIMFKQHVCDSAE
jgi:next-to-BRCA1 protein 1